VAIAATGTSLYLYRRSISGREDEEARGGYSWNELALLYKPSLGQKVYADAARNPIHGVGTGLSSMPQQVGEDGAPGWQPPTRAEMLKALKSSSPAAIGAPRDTSVAPTGFGAADQEDAEGEFDILIVGAGATGAGCALDAATRGLKVACIERDDFAAGTSSRSTKLVHGGVRYLQKAVMELDYEQWKMVKEALHERATFLRIAPYLSFPLPIMLPIYKWWQVPYFWSGCKLYDLLAGRENMESSYFIPRGKAMESFPMLKKENLVGALVYYDGQHNDARMNIALALTAIHHGAIMANHVEVTELVKEGGKTRGAKCRDTLTGETFTVRAKGVINATGPFTDALRKMDEGVSAQEIVAPSSGVHIILPGYYSPGKMGLIDPATTDGRVIFFLPWLGNTIAGTTDSPTEVTADPMPKEEEIKWILDEVRRYLSPDVKVRRGDVLAAWSGIRPLVKDPNNPTTEGLVRNHMINVSASEMVTIAGGKWTTYRAMAQETIDQAIKSWNLEPLRPSQTEKTLLLGSHGWSKTMFIRLIQQYGLETEVAKHLMDTYGDRAWTVGSMAESTGKRWPVHGIRLSEMYPYIEAEVRYAVRREYAASAVDVISRRTRLGFLNATAALEAVPRVIDIMAEELKWDSKRKDAEFENAKRHLISMGLPRTRLDLSMADVRSGQAARFGSEEDILYNRAVFSSNELDKIRASFGPNQSGKLERGRIAGLLQRLGYSINDREVEKIARDVKDDDGDFAFQEVIDVSRERAIEAT